MKLTPKNVVTIVVIAALTNVALGHLGAARKGV